MGFRELFFFFALVLPVFGGDISGRVIITKRLTKKVVTPAVYDLRGSAPAPLNPSEPASVGLESELDRTVVLLERILPVAASHDAWSEGGLNAGATGPQAPITVQINQKGSHFDPELVAIPVGSTVEFPNSDPIFHNVFSLSGAKSFDLGYYPKGKSRSVKFDKSGVVQVYCHIHSNMYAAIVVTASPWFGKPSSDGAFSWSDVPAGHYRLVAWHKVAGYFHTEIDVPAKGTAAVAINVPVDEDARP
jgi:plastocyanin